MTYCKLNYNRKHCSIFNVPKENTFFFALHCLVSELPTVVVRKLGSLSEELVGYCPSGKAGDVTFSQESVAPTVSVLRQCLLNVRKQINVHSITGSFSSSAQLNLLFLSIIRLFEL